jgi:beta-phosphoglucomutase-like phosphatase (HAD superfamily)
MADHPDLIIFDCDGILVDSEPLAVRVNAAMLPELGWHADDTEIIDRFLGRSMASNRATIEAHIGRPLPEGWHERLIANIFALHKAELTAVAGIADALDVIAGWDVEVCVASSGDPVTIRHSLDKVGLRGHFGERIFSAVEVAHGKPAPDLFLHAAASLGVAQDRCVVIEDSQYGVQAARAAGMYAYGYAGGLTPAAWLEGPGTTVFDDMTRLPELLSAAGVSTGR